MSTTLQLYTNGASETMAAVLPQRTIAEFFAGIGLMRMGLERGGWNIAFANDFDPQKYEMYKAQFPDANEHFALDDVYDVPVSSVPTVTLATASFPCVDLSLAGPMNGLKGRIEEDRQQGSGAFWGFIRILEAMAERRPPLVLLENVTSFLTSYQGEDFRVAVQTLNDLGYRVDAFILDAANFVPQSRKRLFVVGIHEALLPPDEEVISARPGETPIRPKQLTDFMWAHSELRWTIRPLPLPQRATLRLEDILEDLPDDAAQWWSSERAQRLFEQMSPRHQEQAKKMIADSRWSYGTVFRRMRQVTQDDQTGDTGGAKVKKSMAELRTDGIAGCLRTPKGGSAKQILFKAGYGRYYARLLTAREVARLMGADDYTLNVTGDQALFGFGDAVCVPAVEWIATYYFNPLISEVMRNYPLRLQRQEQEI